MFMLTLCESISLDYIPVTGTPPSERGNSVVDYSSSANILIVFSGGGENERRNDLWEFNFTNSLWREIVSISQNLPGKILLSPQN